MSKSGCFCRLLFYFEKIQCVIPIIRYRYNIFNAIEYAFCVVIFSRQCLQYFLYRSGTLVSSVLYHLHISPPYIFFYLFTFHNSNTSFSPFSYQDYCFNSFQCVFHFIRYLDRKVFHSYFIASVATY